MSKNVKIKRILNCDTISLNEGKNCPETLMHPGDKSSNS